MAQFNSPLNNVRVAVPCSADWDQMIGNDRARFCSQCNLNVYNLSSMSRSEAEHFISTGEGRICIRYYRRRDGSIITRNCPVGLQAIKRRMSAVARAVCSAVLTFLTAVGLYETLGPIFTQPQRYMGGMMVERELPPPPTPAPVETIIPLQGQMRIKPEQPGPWIGKMVALPPRERRPRAH
jgi:hypothetical protein